jgi:Zn-finger nucleic acid-binding protein
MSTPNCPRDNRPMVLDEYKTHPRHECKQCKGILLEGRHVLAALGSLRSGVPDTSEGAPRLLKLPESNLACPQDGTRMRTAVYSSVEVDVCPVCRSIWFDRGEFEKIVAIVKKRRAEGHAPAKGKGSDSPDEPADGDMSEFVEVAIDMLLR